MTARKSIQHGRSLRPTKGCQGTEDLPGPGLRAGVLTVIVDDYMIRCRCRHAAELARPGTHSTAGTDKAPAAVAGKHPVLFRQRKGNERTSACSKPLAIVFTRIDAFLGPSEGASA